MKNGAFLATTALLALNVRAIYVSSSLKPTAALLATPVVATPAPQEQEQTPVVVRYDRTYDNSSLPLSSVACSDGSNGLEGKGYKTLGQLPDFPYVGAAPTISGWNSPNCGACYNITYNDAHVYLMGVDSATTGFVVSQVALDWLTGNQAVSLGQISASYAAVDASNCVT